MDLDGSVANDAGVRRKMSGDTTDEDPVPSPPPPRQQTVDDFANRTVHVSPSPNPEERHSPLPGGKATSHPGSPQPSSMPKKSSIKKKGTAATIKAPKRGSKAAGPGIKKPGSRSSKPRKPKPETSGTPRGSSAVPSLQADDGSEPEGGEAGEDDANDSGSDQGVYCICRGPDNHRFMIACDRCEDWFHGDCIGMDKYTGENLVQRYICPNCTDHKLMVTRYKKTCAVARCDRPARMYGDRLGAEGEASIFCSEEHCQLWWEQLVRKLPRSREGGTLYGDVLTQEEFMGLLGAGEREDGDEGWRLGDEPFGIPPDFWDTNPPTQVLTEEERSLLAASVSDRHSLGEEIVLCKKMLQLIDMAAKQREQIISSSQSLVKPQQLGKDFCGYDYRLDSVGATPAFAAFVHSPAGEAIFGAGRLLLPGDEGFAAFDGYEVGGINGAVNGVNGTNSVNGAAAAAAVAVARAEGCVCVRRKCKPHMGWLGIHTKNVKHQIKELAAQAKEKLDFETRIRDCAAVRYQRRKRENNRVELVDVDMED